MRRGFALVTVLLMVSVLAILVISLVFVSRQRSFGSRDFQERTLATYVAEAGLAVALQELEQDSGWVEGFDRVPMENVPGNYSLQFQGATPEPWKSVNNLNGSTPVNSYKGDETVPAGSALLVCIGRVGNITRRLEVLVRRGSAPLSRQAMLATGRVRLRGNVEMNGIQTLAGLEEADAGIHTNTDSDAVTWEGEADQKLVVSGKVSSSNPSSNAIALGNGPGDARVEVGETESGAPTVPPPYVDIAGEVASRAGPNVTLSGNNPHLGPGDHYFEGDLLEVQGDLVLDGANLFVEGDLKINGSIVGDGSVYTTGSTRLFGDARVSALEDSKVALFSQGHVHLSGFNGTEFLDAELSGNAAMQQKWQETQDVIDLANREIRNYNGAFSPGNDFGKLQDLIQSKLTTSEWGRQFRYLFQGDHPEITGEWAVLHQVMDHVDALPGGGPSMEFMRERLLYLDETYGSPQDRGNPGTFQHTHSDASWYDGVANGWNDADNWAELRNRAVIMGKNRIGSAYFFGMVYTNGAFYADNEVSVVGMLVAADNGSQQPVTLEGTDVEVKPGDVFLNSGCAVTYVHELLSEDEPDTGATGPTELHVTGWLEN